MSTTVRNNRHQAMMAVLSASRKQAHLTQEELSRCLKRAPNYIAKIENGERRLSVPELFEIAEAIGIEPVVLFSRIDTW